MPRITYCRDPDDDRRRILFGDQRNKACISTMARDLKISQATLHRYRNQPSTIPLDRLTKIIRWRGVTPEQLQELFG